MGLKKTDFDDLIHKGRISDAEYIKELEYSILFINKRVNTFINKMDEATRQSTLAVFETYVQEVKTLRLDK